MKKIITQVVKTSHQNYLATLKYKGEMTPIVQKEGFKKRSKAIEWLNSEIENRELNYGSMNFQKLAVLLQNNSNNEELKETLDYKIDEFKSHLYFNFVVDSGFDEDVAKQNVDSLCGVNDSESYAKCREGIFDYLLDLEYEKEVKRQLDDEDFSVIEIDGDVFFIQN